MKQDSLFNLIHSLSRNEKGYFKKMISSVSPSEDKQIIKLFDAIEAQKEYDEEKLKTKFKDDKLSKNLSVSKNYLFNAILTTLRNYHKEHTISAKIRGLLTDAEYLYSKNLFNEFEEYVIKAKDLAEKNERHLLQLAAMDDLFRSRSLLVHDFKERLLLSEEKYKKQIQILQEYREIIEFRYIWDVYFELSNRRYHNPNLKLELDSLMKSPLLQEDYIPSSYRAGLNHFNILANIYSDLLKDYKKGEDLNRKYLAFLENEDWKLSDDPKLKFGAYSNLMISLLDLGLFDEYKVVLEKFKSYASNFPSLEYARYEKEMMLQQIYFVKSLQVKEGVEYISENEENLYRFEKLMNKTFYIAMIDNYYILYFLGGNFSKALHWTNKMIQYKTDLRLDVKCFAQIFYLIIHYELNNLEHIEYSLRSVKRFLEAHSPRNDEHYDWIVFDFFVELVKCNYEREFLDSFKKLEDRLNEVRHAPHNINVLDFFDIAAWAKSKIEKRPLLEVLREKRKVNEELIK
jgi:hypothetical protein